MNKCANCKHFRVVKRVCCKGDVVDYVIGVCDFLGEEEYINGDEPSCKEFIKKEEKDELYFN